MAGNRAVAYVGPRKVEIQNLDFPKLVDPRGKDCHHGVVLKLVTTNICGSDQHIYRGRFPAPSGMVLGHENTGEVVEVGRDVVFIKKAFTARAFDMTTKELARMSQPGEPLFGIIASNDGRVVIFAGGIPLKVDGQVVGAVGVSGGRPDQDHEVAEAGATAFMPVGQSSR